MGTGEVKEEVPQPQVDTCRRGPHVPGCTYVFTFAEHILPRPQRTTRLLPAAKVKKVKAEPAQPVSQGGVEGVEDGKGPRSRLMIEEWGGMASSMGLTKYKTPKPNVWAGPPFHCLECCSDKVS